MVQYGPEFVQQREFGRPNGISGIAGLGGIGHLIYFMLSDPSMD